MTWDEIRHAYQGRWVLIEYRQLDDSLEVVDGQVIADAPTREEIYRRVMQDGRERNVAIRYCGDPPADFAVMFWLGLRVFDRLLQPVSVIAHDLPFAGPVQGLLGMDALATLRSRIYTSSATIEFA